MNAANNKYQTLMANLLNIDTFDTSLYCSIDNERFFDVYKSFGSEIFDKICHNFQIDLTLTEVGSKEIIKEVEQAQNKAEVISVFKEYNRRIIDPLFKQLSVDFEQARQKIINDLELQFQKSIVKWKKIVNKAQNINIETNIWPLHIGFFFVSVKTEKKTIYAPLFFKEVSFEIKNSLVYLHSKSDIRINSKLVTFLDQEGFLLNVDNFDFSNLSIREVYEYFKNTWSSVYKIPQEIKDKIPNLNQENIKNTTIEFQPGIVLGFYNVSSGYLWNQMKKIIENDEFESILNPDFNKNAYREKINRVIFDNKFKLYKIQDTNFSQDVATVSSMYQDTIIWGPPGTGKSQTISNLIANIVARGFTALVVSQKKAALDVLKNRLKKLSMFCLFALNDKNLRQETFYKPLKEFIYLLENFKESNPEIPHQIFSDDDRFYLDNLDSILKIDDLDNVLDFYAAIVNGKISKESFENLKLLSPNIRYELNGNFADETFLKKHLYQVNFGKKPNLFTIYPREIKEAVKILMSDSNLFTIDIDRAINHVNTINFDSVEQIDSFYKKALIEKTIDLNNDAILAKMMLKKIVERMNDFNEEEKRQYTSFAMAIRTSHLKPYKFFHKHKEMIKILFPIIVTTPELDLSMWSKGEFDYAILDESSQIFIEKGILILYLARRKILAGDSQQMQPTRWFSVSYNFEEENELGNIESLLDYATARGVYSILLDKNYRSKRAALMTFSSRHFYESKLDVVDDFEEEIDNDKAIEVIQTDGVWDNSMNEAEGKKAIQVAKANLDKYKKIIILVFNAKQQDYLITKIFNEEPLLEEALNSDRLQLKNIENIQGDEADLVIMSVVYDRNTSLYGTYVARAGGKNALNVAISRAKEKIIVIKSIYASDVDINERSTSDMILFKEWLKFLDLPLNSQKNYLIKHEPDLFDETKTMEILSYQDFKFDIINQLKEIPLGSELFGFIENYSIGTKTIDLVLINKETNQIILGFIVDSYSYENNYQKFTKFKDDIKFLKAKKYPIITLSKISWLINKKQIIEDIKLKTSIEMEKHEEK
ncbi:DEAD/DEAH box helicase [Metamycoplasma arthritidis]|uniref:Putative ATP-binding helicase n=1 Tax=Metamycoplasma arthritidis (strain 158L3-1) TaxID=243272 RepID=B3PN64_META1|nr:DEAD/DEAH box helicase [Metamycoplasma arthritidis]ACF07466.1 putative ATP-binding helicase [Metamycoplasma arthritidis 158L3-1]